MLSTASNEDDTQRSQLTVLLNRMVQGDHEAGNRAAEMVYAELHRIAVHKMRCEPAGHLLQATVLVNEAYIRLAGGAPLEIRNRGHFFALASRQMRNVLVDHARAELAARRGGRPFRIDFSSLQLPATADDAVLLLLNDALDELARETPQHAQVVELKFFGGYTDKKVAETLSLSLSTVRRYWELARPWLYVAMSGMRPAR
jgi:RNA polymerase sigma factor (TIGR02999 family)